MTWNEDGTMVIECTVSNDVFADIECISNILDNSNIDGLQFTFTRTVISATEVDYEVILSAGDAYRNGNFAATGGKLDLSGN